MAQAHKKSFTDRDTHHKRAQPEASAATPLEFWSNMAEMQRRYFATIAEQTVEKTEETLNANVTELRPSAIAAPAAAIGRNWMAAAAEYQREIVSFMGERMAKNREFLATAVAARDMQELARLQASWMQQAAEDYKGEIGKLTSIIKNGADEAMAVTA